MRIHQTIAGVAISIAMMTASGAHAFETTSVGGTNPDGSAKYQNPDDLQASSMLGGLQTQQGTGTSFTQSPQNSMFGFSVSQSPGETQPRSPFNDPTLRDRP